MAGGGRCGPIQALMLVPSEPHVVADDIQRSYHLAEDQHPVSTHRPMRKIFACFWSTGNCPEMLTRCSQTCDDGKLPSDSMTAEPY